MRLFSYFLMFLLIPGVSALNASQITVINGLTGKSAPSTMASVLLNVQCPQEKPSVLSFWFPVGQGPQTKDIGSCCVTGATLLIYQGLQASAPSYSLALPERVCSDYTFNFTNVGSQYQLNGQVAQSS